MFFIIHFCWWFSVLLRSRLAYSILHLNIFNSSGRIYETEIETDSLINSISMPNRVDQLH